MPFIFHKPQKPTLKQQISYTIKIETMLDKNETTKGTKFEDRTGEITIEELRELSSFKDYSDEQAKQLIATMKSFANIIYNMTVKEEGGTIFANKKTGINISETLNIAA